MQRHADGTWSVSGPPSWSGAGYLFDVRVWSPSAGAVVRNEVTDPYSVALTTNSQRSLMADLDDRALDPAGWSSLRAAGDRAAGGPHRLRAARPRLLHR